MSKLLHCCLPTEVHVFLKRVLWVMFKSCWAVGCQACFFNERQSLCYHHHPCTRERFFLQFLRGLWMCENYSAWSSEHKPWHIHESCPTMISRFDNGEQISKYLSAVRHIFLVRENVSGDSGAQWFDGKQIWGVSSDLSHQWPHRSLLGRLLHLVPFNLPCWSAYWTVSFAIKMPPNPARFNNF